MLEIPVNPTQVNPSADLSLYLMDVIQSIWAQHWVTQVGDESEWMRGKKEKFIWIFYFQHSHFRAVFIQIFSNQVLKFLILINVDLQVNWWSPVPDLTIFMVLPRKLWKFKIMKMQKLKFSQCMIFNILLINGVYPWLFSFIILS